MKDYLLKIPEELHREIKIHAAVNGGTMMQFIIEAIKEKLRRESKTD